MPRRLAHAALQGFVGTQQEVEFACEQEGLVAQHMGHRGIGVQPQGLLLTDVADVVAARGDGGGFGAPVEAGCERHAHARRALERAHAAHQHGGAEKAAARREAGRKVGDKNALTLGVPELGVQHGGVGVVVLPGFIQVFDFDRERAGTVFAAEQRVKHRIAVKAGQAAPDHAPVRIDQGAEGAIAHHAERQGGGGGRGKAGVGEVFGGGRWVHYGVVSGACGVALRSHWCSACGWAMRWVAQLGPSPTLMPAPPSR